METGFAFEIAIKQRVRAIPANRRSPEWLYLAPGEIRELNRLTTILLDIFEDQLDIGRLVTMDDARRLLDDQLRSLGRAVLASGGSVRMTDARRLAEDQYETFAEQRRLDRHRQADEAIADLTRQARALPKTPGPKSRKP